MLQVLSGRGPGWAIAVPIGAVGARQAHGMHVAAGRGRGLTRHARRRWGTGLASALVFAALAVRTVSP